MIMQDGIKKAVKMTVLAFYEAGFVLKGTLKQQVSVMSFVEMD